MLQLLDTFFERIAPEARMLWAFIQGHVLMMAIPAFSSFQVVNDRRGPDQPLNLIPVIIWALIGVGLALPSWVFIHFCFPHAASRFINVTRMAIHILVPQSLFTFYVLPLVLEPDPPGYVVNKGVLYIAGLIMIALLALITRDAIFSTTKTYIEIRDKV